MSTIKYFGVIAEIVGKKEEERSISNIKVKAFKKEFLKSYPELSTEFQIAINQNLVNEDAIIHDDNEIALLPPYSGG